MNENLEYGVQSNGGTIRSVDSNGNTIKPIVYDNEYEWVKNDGSYTRANGKTPNIRVYDAAGNELVCVNGSSWLNERHNAYTDKQNEEMRMKKLEKKKVAEEKKLENFFLLCSAAIVDVLRGVMNDGWVLEHSTKKGLSMYTSSNVLCFELNFKDRGTGVFVAFTWSATMEGLKYLKPGVEFKPNGNSKRPELVMNSAHISNTLPNLAEKYPCDIFMPPKVEPSVLDTAPAAPSADDAMLKIIEQLTFKGVTFDELIVDAPSLGRYDLSMYAQEIGWPYMERLADALTVKV